MMKDQELFQAVHNQLFVGGSCKPNEWKLIKIALGEKVALFEAMLPNRGNIRVRKPIKKQRVNCDGQEIWLYKVFKFTNKKQLVDEGLLEDIRLDQKEGVTV